MIPIFSFSLPLYFTSKLFYRTCYNFLNACAPRKSTFYFSQALFSIHFCPEKKVSIFNNGRLVFKLDLINCKTHATILFKRIKTIGTQIRGRLQGEQNIFPFKALSMLLSCGKIKSISVESGVSVSALSVS